MASSFTSCPLTGVKIPEPIKFDTYYEYPINIDDRAQVVRISVIDHEFWLSEDVKHYQFLNYTLFFNGEWPVDSEITVTRDLVQRVVRRHLFPRLNNTAEKGEYFIAKIYTMGGDNLDPIYLSERKYPYAFVENSEKFRKLLYKLREENLIKLNLDPLTEFGSAEAKIDLTPLGDKKALEVIKSHYPGLIKPDAKSRPALCLIYDQQDAPYAKTIHKVFERSVASWRDVVLGPEHGTNTYKLDDLRTTFQNSDQIIVFILSDNSQSNSSFSGALNLARTFTGDFASLRLHFCAVTDIDIDNFNIVTDYHNNVRDLRYNPDRVLLHNNVIKAYSSLKAQLIPATRIQPKKSYSFPKFQLNENERRWLEISYDLYKSDQEIEYRVLFDRYWDNFDKEFDPKKINKLLIQDGKKITLLGIWHIDPGSDIFEKFDRFMFAIQDRIKTGEFHDKLESVEIKPLLDDLSDDELVKMVRLLQFFHRFTSGWGYNHDTKLFHISIGDDSIHRNFLEYTGIEVMMKNHVDHWQKPPSDGTEENNPIEDDSKNRLSNNLDKEAFNAGRKGLKIQDPKDIEGVINVQEIAEEVWLLVKDMPEEKGIFGIFGKWGRGKSFLINKVKELIKKDSVANRHEYVVVDFDAWKYQDTPASWAYLYETLIDKYVSGGSRLRRAFSLNKSKHGLFPIYITLFPILVSIVWYSLPGELKSYVLWEIILGVGITGLMSVLVFYFKHLPKAKKLFKQYSSIKDYKHLLGVQSEIQSEMEALIKHWIGNPKDQTLILIIENLDRCDENKMLPLIDALRVVLEETEISKRVKVIAAVDEGLIVSCVHQKFKNFIERNPKSSNRYITEYLDKIFISGIRLNPLSSEDNADVITAIAHNEHKWTGMSYEDFHRHLEEVDLNDRAKTEEAKETEEFEYYSDEGNNEFANNNKSQTQEANSTEPSNQDIKDTEEQKQLLSFREVNLIRSFAKKYTRLTPRRLRIIYFRYHLAKNLLNATSKGKEINLWRNYQYSKVLVELIFRYSASKTVLDNIKIRDLDRIKHVSITLDEGNVEITYKEYLKLLNVLRMVIVF